MQIIFYSLLVILIFTYGRKLDIKKIILIKRVFVFIIMLSSFIMFFLTEEQLGIFDYFILIIAMPTAPLWWGRFIYDGIFEESSSKIFFSYKTFELVGVLGASFLAFASWHYMYKNFYL